MIYVLGAFIVIILLVMGLKKVFHLQVEDKNYSEEDDYLERRIKKDEDDN